MSCSVPVVFIIFRRPELTARVFETIRVAKPSQLLIIADGPRDAVDAALCEQTRAIAEQVDWECEVLRNYSAVNLGCKTRVSSGLDWAFSQVEEAIILEDDCLPSSSFFAYCEALLKKYRHDTRIMHIGGHNFLCSDSSSPYSYYFSGLTQIWGWATWRRAWQLYDANMTQWPVVKNRYPSIFDRFSVGNAVDIRMKIWERVYCGEIDSWDYSWLFTVCSQSGLCILPKVNLVSNIGFGTKATHTTKRDKSRENLPRGEIDFPLVHPELVLRDRSADNRYLEMSIPSKPCLIQRGANLLRSCKSFFRLCLQLAG